MKLYERQPTARAGMALYLAGLVEPQNRVVYAAPLTLPDVHGRRNSFGRYLDVLFNPHLLLDLPGDFTSLECASIQSSIRHDVVYLVGKGSEYTTTSTGRDKEIFGTCPPC
jgi:hypothetical protein